jgi:hypothetical protein
LQDGPASALGISHASTTVTWANNANRKNLPILSAKKMIVETHDKKKKMQLSVCSFVLLFRFALSQPLSLAIDMPLQ